MMRQLAFCCALLAVTVTAAAAAPLERDLGLGLDYARVQRLPADLPGNPPGRAKPVVIDLRFAEGDADAAKVFAAWLKFRATPRAPVFVLANSATAPAMLLALAARPAVAGVVVVGAGSFQLRPDSEVKVSPEEDRCAYDALANGAALEALLTDNPDKVRNDEASLTKGQLGEPPAKRDGPPVDVALQRAVHLHRALVALKRL